MQRRYLIGLVAIPAMLMNRGAYIRIEKDRIKAKYHWFGRLDFSRMDQILFSVMGFVELLTVIGLFYWAGRCSKHPLPIEHLKYRLRGAIIATEPLPTEELIDITESVPTKHGIHSDI